MKREVAAVGKARRQGIFVEYVRFNRAKAIPEQRFDVRIELSISRRLPADADAGNSGF